MDAKTEDKPCRTDRRTMLRHCRELSVSVGTLDASVSHWFGWTHNLSAQGLSVTLDRRFEPGTPMSITFDEGTTAPLTVLAKVMRVEAVSRGWLHGCQFAKSVDDDEFRQLLEEVQKAPRSPPEVETTSTPQRVDLRAIRAKLRKMGSAPHREPIDPSP